MPAQLAFFVFVVSDSMEQREDAIPEIASITIVVSLIKLLLVSYFSIIDNRNFSHLNVANMMYKKSIWLTFYFLMRPYLVL